MRLFNPSLYFLSTRECAWRARVFLLCLVAGSDFRKVDELCCIGSVICRACDPRGDVWGVVKSMGGLESGIQSSIWGTFMPLFTYCKHGALGPHSEGLHLPPLSIAGQRPLLESDVILEALRDRDCISLRSSSNMRFTWVLDKEECMETWESDERSVSIFRSELYDNELESKS